MIAKKYTDLLKKLTPFVLSYKENLKSFNLQAFDTAIDEEYCFNALDISSESFYQLLRQTDELTFGDQGMAMDGWMYFDCAAMPGAIVGFGLLAQDIPQDLLQKFKIPKNYSGIIPLSMFIAIPMVGDRWFGHNLSSLGKHLGVEFKGLGLLTKAYGIEVLKIKEMFGATQWGSPAINIHSKLAPMRLRTTVTPIHTHTNTLCYSSIYSMDSLENALSDNQDKSEECFLIEACDSKLQDELQLKIQNGEEFTLYGKPIYKDNKIYYKIRKS